MPHVQSATTDTAHLDRTSMMPSAPSSTTSIDASIMLRALEGTRWLVVDSNAQAAEAIARVLRTAGAQVKRVDVVGLQLSRLHTFDAQLVLVDEGQDLRFLQDRMVSHAALRWACTLSLPWSSLWQDASGDPNVEVLARAAYGWLDADRNVHDLACGEGDVFSTHNGALGAIRTLRAVSRANNVFRLSFAGEGAQGHVETAGNLLLGAWFQQGTEPMLMGAEALAGVIEMPEAAVTVRRKVRPKAPWFVLPIDEGLALALEVIRERRLGECDDSPTMRIDPELVAEAVRQEQNDAPSEAVISMPAHTMPAASIPSPAPHSQVGPRALVAAAILSVAATIILFARPAQGPVPPQAPAAQAVVLKPSAPATQAPPPDDRLRKTTLPTAARPLILGSTANEATANKPRAELPRTDPEAELSPSQFGDAESNLSHALATRAKAALLRRDLDEAYTLAERATVLRPRHPQYRLLLGDALAASERHEEALEQYKVGLSLRPDSRTLKQRLARTQAALDQY